MAVLGLNVSRMFMFVLSQLCGQWDKATSTLPLSISTLQISLTETTVLPILVAQQTHHRVELRVCEMDILYSSITYCISMSTHII